MRIVLITQNDPFFLAENINYLINTLPSHSEIVGCVLFDLAAFGKKKSLFEQAKETYGIFGVSFFIKYGTRYVLNKVNKNKNISYVLGQHGIPLIKLGEKINHPTSIEALKKFNPDLLVSIAGNQIFKKPIIELAPKGCLNLHTALLPKYRGLMPTFWVLKNNEKETGVSVFFVDEGIDSGPIIVQNRIPISNENQEELIRITKKCGMDAINEAIDKIYHDNFILIENPDENMTYFSKPSRKDVLEFLAAGKRFF